MKCYRTTKEFVREVCRETGQSRPKQTCYIVQDCQNATRIQQKAPNSYHGLKQVSFCADGRFVTRRFGLWVDSANAYDMAWLEQRQLHEAVDRLRNKDVSRYFLEASRNLDPEVEQKLNQYLSSARWNLYQEFNRKVIDEALQLMEKDRCFSTLECRGDLLNQAVA
jgi:hypothetical protein